MTFFQCNAFIMGRISSILVDSTYELWDNSEGGKREKKQSVLVNLE